MYEYLRQHPQVFMAERKEPLFFATDLPGIPGHRVSDREEYMALFARARDERRIGEATPYYLYSASASTGISRECADPRIIIMLRNPADMMYSMYWAWSFAGFDAATSFEAAVDGGHRPSGEADPFLLDYRSLATTVEHVARYLDLFGRSHVHIVLFDDLVRDPSAVYLDVCRFLDVTVDCRPDLALSAFRRAASRRPLIPPLSRFLASTRQVARGPVARRVVGLIRDGVRRWASAAPPPMSPAIRQQILAECRSDIRRLGDVIGRDLTEWGSQRAPLTEPATRQDL